MATRNTDTDGLLARLGRFNKTTVFLVTLGVMLAALFVPGVYGALLLLALVGGLAALLVRTWPYLPGSARALRLLVLALLVVAAVNKL